jgi:hypothetical protein
MPIFKKVLISDASSYKAVVIAKFLKKTYPGIIIHMYDYRPCVRFLHTKYCDKFHLITKDVIFDERYCHQIHRIINQEMIDLFIPVNSSELSCLMLYKNIFGDTFNYMGDIESYTILNDKAKTYNLCETLGIWYPKAISAINPSFPLVMKPKISSSAKGVYYVYDHNNFEALCSKLNLEEYLIQEHISGIGIGYSVFAQNGEILIGNGHKRLGEYPTTGGSSVYREQYHNPDMEAVARKILKTLNWSGFAMIEFKLTPSNELCLIEVNPRIWGSINQGLSNNINYFSPLLGAPPNIPIKNASNIKTYLAPLAYLSFVIYCFKGNFKPCWDFLKSWHKAQADICFFDDPCSYIALLMRK